MDLPEKLQLIQMLSGLTQQQLAGKIGVSFAALNRWMNKKSTPHPARIKKIDALYFNLTGQKNIPGTALSAKKLAIAAKRRKRGDALRIILQRPDLQGQFDLSLTYNSNRIEGSTLTENETGAILFHNKALPNKSLTEQLEAKNHQAALHFLFDYIKQHKTINEAFILQLHTLLMNGIRPDAGRYRTHGVRIVGTRVVTANFLKVPALMHTLLREIEKPAEDIIAHVSRIHARFEQIHPFADGNGRVGRLLIHAMFLKKGFPPALIQQKKRQKYFLYLSKAQIAEDYGPLEDFMCDTMLESYRIMDFPTS